MLLRRLLRSNIHYASQSIANPKKQKHRFHRALIKSDKYGNLPNIDEFEKLFVSFASVRPPLLKELDSTLQFMEKHKIEATPSILTSTLVACAHSHPSKVQRAEEIIRNLEQRNAAGEQAYRAMLYAYSRSEPHAQVENAEVVFDEMRYRGWLAKHGDDHKTLMSAYARSSRSCVEKAEKLLSIIKADGIGCGIEAYNGVLMCLCSEPSVSIAKIDNYLSEMKNAKLEWNRVTFETVLMAYAKANPVQKTKFEQLYKRVEEMMIPETKKMLDAKQLIKNAN